MSIILEPGEIFWLWESNKGNTLLNLLSILMIGPLISSLWQEVSKSNKKQWEMLWNDGLDSSNNYIVWL